MKVCRRRSISSRRPSWKTRSSRSRIAGWPTRTACWRITACGRRHRRGPRRRRARRRRSCSTAPAPKGGRRWRMSRRRRTGTGTARSVSSRWRSGSTRATRPGITGLRRRAWCRSDASTRRSTRCASRNRSIRCRRSSRATLAIIHAYRRDYEAALEQCDHTIELNPHFSPAYWALGMIQEQRRDLDEAIAAFQRAIDLSPHSPRMHAALARTLALAGRRRDALASLRKVEVIAKQRYVSPMVFAAVRFALDQPELGFPRAQQGLRGSRFRRPGAEGRSPVRAAEERPAAPIDSA